MTTTVESTPPVPPAPRKKGKRWLKALLVIVVLILLLVLLAPTLMSTGAGKGIILGQVNSRIAGSVEADSVSVGWFSQASMRNLRVKDPDGKVILDVPSADTGLSLMNAVMGSVKHLNIVVRAESATLMTNADGTNNLARAFASKSAVPASTQPSAGSSSPASKKTTVPEVIATFDVQIHHITCQSPNAPVLTIDDTTAKGSVDTVGGATQLTFNAVAKSGEGKPATISANVDGNFFSNGAVKPMGEITGKGNAGLQSLDLAAVTPLLAAAGLNYQVTGTMEASAKLDDSGGKPTLNASVKVAQLTLTGAALEGDTLKRDQLTVNLQAALAGDNVDVQQLALDTQGVSAKVHGNVKTGQAAGGPMQPVNIAAVIDVTDLKKQLPHLLGTVPDTTATVNFTGEADTAKKILTITSDSTIAEKDPQTGLGNTVGFKAGSVIAWGGGNNDMTVPITYNLSRAQGILAKHLPEGTILQGTRTMTLHVTGALADAPGLAALQHLNMDPAAFGYDRMFVKGFDMGKAEIGFSMKSGVITLTPNDLPANGGSIHLAGRIDCTQVPAAFILDTPAQGEAFVKNVALNQEIAAGPLAFLPLAWGSKNGSIGQVTGQMNVSLAQTFIPLTSEAFKQKGATSGTLSITNLTTDAPFFSQLFGALGGVLKLVQLNQVIQGAQITNGAFALKEGKVTYQNLTLGAKQANLVFSGSVGVDTSLAMNVDVTVAALKIPIPVGLAGTTASPKLSVSDRGMGQNLGNTIQNVIPNVSGGLDGLFNKKKK